MNYYLSIYRYRLKRITSNLLGRIAVSAALAYPCAYTVTYVVERFTAL